MPSLKPVEKKCGAFCVVIYEGNLFPGEIISLDDEGAKVSTMQKSIKSWKWPEKEDAIDYAWDQVKGMINPPIQINKRGFYKVPELEPFL